MKRKLFFIIPIIALVLFLTSCSALKNAFRLSMFDSDTSTQVSSSGGSTSSQSTPRSRPSKSEASTSVSSKTSDNTTPSTQRSTSEALSNSTNINTETSTNITPTTSASENTPSSSVTPTTSATATQHPYSSSTTFERKLSTLAMETLDPTVTIENIDTDISKIKIAAYYNDGTKETINLSKHLIPTYQYNQLINSDGYHLITINYDGMNRLFEIKSVHRNWNVIFYNYNGDEIANTEVVHGTDAVAPTEPGDYYDNGTIYEFDEWDKSLSNVTSDRNITAKFKEKEKIALNYSTTINTSTTADINVNSVGSVTSYNIVVKNGDESFNESYTGSSISLTGLDTNTKYYISGTYKFLLNGVEETKTIRESTFTTPKRAISYLSLETNQTLTIENLETELSNIDVGLYYDNDDMDTIQLSKDLISEADYNSLLEAGDHNVTITYAGKSKLFKLKSAHSPRYVKFYDYNGSLVDTVEVAYGETASAPSNPGDYYQSGKIYTFDEWDSSLDNITSNCSVYANYKVKESISFDYSTLITASTNADININTVGTFSAYDLTVRNSNDETTSTNIIQRLNMPFESISVTGLESNKTYYIGGTYSFMVNGVEMTENISKTTFTTGMFNAIDSITQAYVIDTEAVSYDSLSVDLSTYIDGTPEGYTFKGVALVDDNDDLVEEKEYDGNVIVFFDSLTPETEYTTYFFYDRVEVTNLTAWYTEVNGNQYRSYFRGFTILTSPDNPDMRCVRIMYSKYNEIDGKDVLLYRYYVSKGQSVNSMWVDPFSFRLPIQYEGYRTVGNYSDLLNITEDKVVEVMLMPETNELDTDRHLVIFMTNYSGDIIKAEWVNDGDSVTEPVNSTDFTYTVPASTDEIEYQFTWSGLGDYSLDEVTKSLLLYPGYRGKYLTNVPTFSPSSSYVYVGSNFATFAGSVGNRTQLVDGDNSYHLYAIEKATGTRIEPAYTKGYSNKYGFEGLKPNTEYIIHFDIDYYLYDDKSEIATKVVTFPITTSAATIDYMDNPTFSSPYYHTIRINDGSRNSVYYYAYLKQSEVSEGIGKNIGYAYKYTNRTVTDISNLYQNCAYRIYSMHRETANCDDSGKAKEVVYYRVSGKYYEYNTIAGEKPLTFKLRIKCKLSSDGNYYLPVTNGNYSNCVQLYITNYTTQRDIGDLTISYDMNVLPSDYIKQYGTHNMSIFTFDSAAGCYKIKDDYYSLYFDIFSRHLEVADPDNPNIKHDIYIEMSQMWLQYFYDGWMNTQAYVNNIDSVDNYNNYYIPNYNFVESDNGYTYNGIFIEFYL